MYSNEELIEALYSIPADADYDEWLSVGMALKAQGFDVSTFDSWSSQGRKYRGRDDIEKRWASFEGQGITAGTLVEIAKQYGWHVNRVNSQKTYSFEDDVPVYHESKAMIQPLYSDRKAEAIAFINTLFHDGEYINIVASSFSSDEGIISSGIFNQTAEQWVEQIRQAETLEQAIGYNPDKGAWIRCNPLDGQGVKDRNVSSYRYALVECDTMTIQEQYRRLLALKLPIATLTMSGGKSIHALVKIGANSSEQYKERVRYLHEYCLASGFEIDKACKNAGRLSRLAGCMRGNEKQALIGINLGCKDFGEWQRFTSGQELPPPTTFAEMLQNEQPLPPEIISGLLREGAKMLITADSKAGKTFLLQELALSMSCGKPWLGFDTKKSKVLYLNLEVENNEFAHRLKTIYEVGSKLQMYNEESLENLSGISLTGRNQNLDELADLIISVAEKNYDVIIVDPIYKVLTGDENSASEMAHFVGLLDKIRIHTGASIIYAHHHAKGSQAGKMAMDRASGSGVFIRDTDAHIDLARLAINQYNVDQLNNDWNTSYQLEDVNGFRCTYTTRSFRAPSTHDAVFTYPLHRRDDFGRLRECHLYTSRDEIKASGGAAAEDTSKLEMNQDKKQKQLLNAFNGLNDGNGANIEKIATILGKSDRTLRRWIEDSDDLYIKENIVYAYE